LFETVKITMRDDTGAPSVIVGVARDITERHKVATADREIEQLAYYDPLTRLPNRRLLLERLSRALATSRRVGSMAPCCSSISTNSDPQRYQRARIGRSIVV
jgi:predicted signal transduction protein with EAL and GGDEF domain